MSSVHRRTSFFVSVVFVIAITIIWMTIPLSAASVVPTVVAGNPDCGDLGYDFGYKPQPEPPPTGTYQFPEGGSVNLTSDGTYFDWTSTLGLDAVIVKGGPNANVYTYVPEAFGDNGLNAPLNASGTPAAISHIEFCYDFEVTVAKTVETRFEQSFDWWISKAVVWSQWDLFVGDKADSYYTIEAVAEPTNSYFVSGFITVTNPAYSDAIVIGVSDLMSAYGNVGLSCVDQHNSPVPFSSGGVFTTPVTLAPGDILSCSFTDVQVSDGASRMNTATATTTGIVGGGSAMADVIFNAKPDAVTDAVITVDDDNTATNPDWTFDATSPTETFTRTYTKTFACANETGYTHTNTVTILGDADHPDGNSDDATVTVNCYPLLVSKTVIPSYVRDYDWSIEKTASYAMNGTVINPITAMTLAYGQQGPITVDYSISLDVVSKDSYSASGLITIENPNPVWAAAIKDVQDYVAAKGTLSQVDAIVSNCSIAPNSFGIYWIPPSDVMTCEYEIPTLPNDTTRTNFAVASLINWDYVSTDGGYTVTQGTQVGITNFDNSPGMPVTFGLPTALYDECVDAYDVRFIDSQGIVSGFGTICVAPTVASGHVSTINYPIDISLQLDTLLCELQYVVNSAGFKTNDNGEVDVDGWQIVVNIACDYGCTLTQGYWKTHSAVGPAPYDDDWANLGDADGDTVLEEHLETFFLSGQSYLDVLLTPPKGGNAYYILAHQYIAAELNKLAGTSAPQEVVDALANAKLLFEANTPDAVASLKGKQRKNWLDLATLLDDYNNGRIGPGHCTE